MVYALGHWVGVLQFEVHRFPTDPAYFLRGIYLLLILFELTAMCPVAIWSGILFHLFIKQRTNHVDWFPAGFYFYERRASAQPLQVQYSTGTCDICDNFILLEYFCDTFACTVPGC